MNGQRLIVTRFSEVARHCALAQPIAWDTIQISPTLTTWRTDYLPIPANQIIYTAIIKLLGKLIKRLDSTRGTDTIIRLLAHAGSERHLVQHRRTCSAEILADLCARRRRLYQHVTSSREKDEPFLLVKISMRSPI